MVSITVTVKIDENFDDLKVIEILNKLGLIEMAPKTNYQKWIRKGEDLTVTRFEKKLLIQGKETDASMKIINELSAINVLDFDKKDDELKLFEFSHNAIYCKECSHPSVMLINGSIEGSNLVFRQECGHENHMKPPFLVYTSRILPDLSVLVAGYISKCMNLGYFEKFEILIPDFIIQSIDRFSESNQKKGASRELEKLRELKHENKIELTFYKDGFDIPKTKDEYKNTEDNIILEIAKITNSILFTGDVNLKIKSTYNDRPTIFIHPEDAASIKSFSELNK